MFLITTTHPSCSFPPATRAGAERHHTQQTADAQKWEGPAEDKEHWVHHHHLRQPTSLPGDVAIHPHQAVWRGGDLQVPDWWVLWDTGSVDYGPRAMGSVGSGPWDMGCMGYGVCGVWSMGLWTSVGYVRPGGSVYIHI